MTDVQAGDLDGDGDLDLSVAQFGYTQGQVQWFENMGQWNFTPHQLIERSGAIHALIVDIDNDGDLDIVTLLSQEWESVVAFVNNGKGSFMPEILHDVADADFSSSGIMVADVDGDGDQDILWTNGDTFVSVDYRPLPTHGLQWLENHGNRKFEFHRIGRMDGAYSPTAVDMDNDGDLDIVTVSEFAFWEIATTPSLRWWEQVEDGMFVARNLATAPTHLVTCDVGDLDGNGYPDIVAGGMALYPPFDRITRISRWMNGETTLGVAVSTETIPTEVQHALLGIANEGMRGMILHANGLDASGAYAEAMKGDPTNPKWPYFLGLLKLALGQSDTALQYFQDAEKLDPNYKPLQTRLGELYAGLDSLDVAREKFQHAGTEYATVALAHIAATEKQWLEVLRLLDTHTSPSAMVLKQTAQSKIDGASSPSTDAVDMGYQMNDPWLSEVEAQCVLVPMLVTKAQTHVIGGRIDDAELLLQKSIQIDPSDTDARVALASILIRPDRISATTIGQAIKHLEIALKIDPSYVMIRAKYGWVLYLDRRFDDATRVWNAILRDEPNHGPVLMNLAQLELQQKQYENAYEHFQSAFQIPNDSPFAMSGHPVQRSLALYRYALSAKGLGKTEEAVALLQSAQKLSPSDATIQFELGNTLISQKKYEDALPHIEIAHALQPKNPRILAALGYTWLQLGNLQNASKFLQEAVNIAPTFALAWFHLGNVQLAQGDRLSAIDSFTVAVRLQPNFTAAKDALANLN